MGKRDALWTQVPQDEDGQIDWESVLDSELQVASGKPPEPGAKVDDQEVAQREVFASMTEAQRQVATQSIKRACFGTLYWILVKLENFPSGNVDFTVEPWSPSGAPLPMVGIEQLELHHLYLDWVEQFSDYGDE